MGEACEHFLYDKGYGPTNLTLKRHLAALFPEARTTVPVEEDDRFPALQSTIIPIGDGSTSRSRATGPLAGPRRKAAASGYTRVVTERPVVAATSSVREPALPTTRRLPKTLPLAGPPEARGDGRAGGGRIRRRGPSEKTVHDVGVHQALLGVVERLGAARASGTRASATGRPRRYWSPPRG